MSKIRKDITVKDVLVWESSGLPVVRTPLLIRAIYLIGACALLVGLGMAIGGPHAYWASDHTAKIPTPTAVWVMLSALVTLLTASCLNLAYEAGFQRALDQKTHRRKA